MIYHTELGGLCFSDDSGNDVELLCGKDLIIVVASDRVNLDRELAGELARIFDWYAKTGELVN